MQVHCSGTHTSFMRNGLIQHDFQTRGERSTLQTWLAAGAGGPWSPAVPQGVPWLGPAGSPASRDGTAWQPAGLSPAPRLPALAEPQLGLSLGHLERCFLQMPTEGMGGWGRRRGPSPVSSWPLDTWLVPADRTMPKAITHLPEAEEPHM